MKSCWKDVAVQCKAQCSVQPVQSVYCKASAHGARRLDSVRKSQWWTNDARDEGGSFLFLDTLILIINQTDYTKPNRPNQMDHTNLSKTNPTEYLTQATKPNWPDQSDQTKATRPNWPNKISQTPSLSPILIKWPLTSSRLLIRSCCHKAIFSKTLAGVFFWCLFIYRNGTKKLKNLGRRFHDWKLVWSFGLI